MIFTLFMISIGLLLLSVLLSMFIQRAERLLRGIIFFLFGTSIMLIGCMLFTRLYGQQLSFLSPGWLWLLVLPLFIFTLRFYATRHFVRSITYPLAGTLAPGFSVSAVLTRWGKLICSLLALACLIIAMARPVTVNKSKLPPVQGIDIMMIIDASASMMKEDFFPVRFVAAQKNAINFINKRFNDRVGLVLFAKNASLVAPLTLDHDAVQELIASLYVGMIDPNSTAVGDALGVASNHLKNSTAKSKIILLLTDGSNNAGALDPVLAARAAAAYGIKVYTIATASPPIDSIFSSREDEIDEGVLMQIANETGGAFYRAKNEMELQAIYDEINELEKTDFTQTAQLKHSDIYFIFLLIGVGWLLLGVVLEKLIFIKVP